MMEQMELGAAAPNKSTRGGARKGAGRPKKDGPTASERVIFRLTPEQLAQLDAAGQPGESSGEIARRLLMELLDRSKRF